MNLSKLPIHSALPALRSALRADGSSVVLHAPPGAGKSTVVPLALLDEPWAAGRRIVMLEPRRLAARAVAARMAATCGERVGGRVGHRMRLDTRVSAETRIEVVTEGVLTRMLQHDPSLEGIALVIFDEYHERSLQADLGLALTLDARAGLSPKLRILVMSATLDVEPVAALLGDATVVRADGRTFPVETVYVGQGLPPMPGTRAGASDGLGRPARARDPERTPSSETLVARIVARALGETDGDILVFLPGAAEIRRVESLLEGGAGGLGADAARNVRVVPLFGDLDPAAQDAALAPSAEGTRKIVLATNIAETSLTIEGVRVVVDSGLVRTSLFDPATGMSRLETQRISRASAEQRRGRAGRTAPGVCYRAWSEAAQRSLAPAAPPEILSADLAPLAIELASWGVEDAASLRWLDPPPAAAFASARDLLQRLGALDRAGRITPHGRRMAALGVHPRLAHMLLRASELGALETASRLAAILSDRDLLRGRGPDRDADISARLALLDVTAAEEVSALGANEHQRPPRLDRGALHRVRRAANDIARQVAAQSGRPAPRSAAPAVGLLLAFAYPDRIGVRRPGADARYTLANGRGAVLSDAQTLAREDLIVAIDVDDRDRDARILLAAPLARGDLETHFADDLEHAETIEWNAREQAVNARRFIRYGAIVIDEKPLPQIPPQAVKRAMLDGLRALGLDALPWTREARDLQARIEFARRLDLPDTADWPAFDDESLAAALSEWLDPWVDGMSRREHLARLPLVDALSARLGWERRRRIDELAPPRLTVPSGSSIRIDYLDENAPVVAVRLQELFGLDESPRIGAGRVPITFQLLSPAQRPVQVTRDLASFWRGAYRDVRKDLRGRYPKHHWPENPLEAEPTRGSRRRPPEA